MQRLRVKQGVMEEINRDIVRVCDSRRKTCNGHGISSGSICWIFVEETKRGTYAILRGHPDYLKYKYEWDENHIIFDETLRERLNLKEKEEYSFCFFEACWVCRIKWAWDASDPAYKIATRIAITLGSISVLLGVISLF